MPDMNKARFLRDEASQILALSDALAAAHGPAISAAFDDVARTRGLATIAAEADISLQSLSRALVDPARPDRAILEKVVAEMIRSHPRLRDPRG